MSFFKPKADTKGISLVVRDNNDRQVCLIQTQKKQKRGNAIFKALVPGTDQNMRAPHFQKVVENFGYKCHS